MATIHDKLKKLEQEIQKACCDLTPGDYHPWAKKLRAILKQLDGEPRVEHWRQALAHWDSPNIDGVEQTAREIAARDGK